MRTTRVGKKSDPTRVCLLELDSIVHKISRHPLFVKKKTNRKFVNLLFWGNYKLRNKSQVNKFLGTGDKVLRLLPTLFSEALFLTSIKPIYGDTYFLDLPKKNILCTYSSSGVFYIYSHLFTLFLFIFKFSIKN